jgi:hypothetical protein
MSSQLTHIISLFADFQPSGLIYDKWFDAAHPYGRTIRALLVVEGWNIMRLLQLIGVGAFLIVSIVSIITETFHSPEVGLTAGTYTVSLLAILLTMFIFMSAII